MFRRKPTSKQHQPIAAASDRVRDGSRALKRDWVRHLHIEALEDRCLLSAGPTPVGPEFRVDTSGNSGNPQVAADAAGDYVIVWDQEGNGSIVYAQRYNAAGAALGSAFQVNPFTTGSQSFIAVAMDSAGDFVVVWESEGADGSGSGVYAQRYSATGAAQGGVFQVNTYTTGDQAHPSVAMDAAGDFVVAWDSNGEDGSGAGVYAQRYNAAGAAQGSEFQVNTYTTNDQNYPSVAMDSAGDFVVAWTSYGQDGSSFGVYAQSYNALGAAQGSEFRVNTVTTGSQGAVSVGMDSAGDFVVAWQSNGQDVYGYGIEAQRYDSSGTALGSEFEVYNDTTTSQDGPEVALDAVGDFVVTWSSYGQDGSSFGVYAQSYNALGAAQGSEFRVNTYTTGIQIFPSVGMDSTGDFVVGWAGIGPSGYGIYAQMFSSAVDITSSSSATFTAGSATTFTVTASGVPTPTFSETGTLPAGVTFNGTTGVLSASATTAVGRYPIEFTAQNGVSSDATQAFVLNVVASSVPVPDGGFETPNVSNGAPTFHYDPSGSPWTFAGMSGIAGNGSAFTADNPAAPEGVQVAYLQDTGSASQSISFQPGIYLVTFEAAQRAGGSQQTVEVLIDGQVVGAITPKSTTYEPYSSNSFTISAAGNHTLTLEGMAPTSGDNTALINAVTIQAGQPNQPFDQGFEIAAQGSGASAYQYDPTDSLWTFSGLAGVAGDGSAFTADNPNAPQGSQVAFIQKTGSVSQSFNMAPGVYDVTFDAAQRAGGSQQTVQVLVDGQIIGSITPTGTSYASYTSGNFAIGTAGNHTLTLVGLDPFGGDNTAFIDAVSVQTVTANQPVDPGFESPNLGTGSTAYQYEPASSPWTFNGLAGVAGNASAFTAGNPAAPQGSQVAFLQDTGSASESVTLAAGTYVLAFDAAQRAGGSQQAVQVRVDGTPISTITPTSTTYALYTTTSFTVGSGPLTIELSGLDPHGGDNTAFIDQVSIVAALANQPIDPGFEKPSLGAGLGAYQYEPPDWPWMSDGMAGVTGNGSAFTENNPNAPQGEQVGFLQQTGSLSQSVTLAGGVYSLSLDAAQRAGGSQQTFEVLVDNRVVSTITPTGSSYAQYNTATFTVASGATAIELLGLNPNGGDNTVFIDQVFLNWV